MDAAPNHSGACSPVQLGSSALFGAAAFFVLGAVGNLRRAPLPLLLNALYNINQRMSHGSPTLRQVFQLPLWTGSVGLVLGGYIGYRECQLEKEFREKWTRKKRLVPSPSEQST